jgi:hypothetical protein
VVVSRIATSIVFALACTTACKYEFVEGPNEAAEEDSSEADSSEADSSEADSSDTQTTQDEMGTETGSNTDETGSPPVCGDGFVDGGEQCDAQDFSGRDCTNFGFMGGQLTCDDECKVDTTMCE